MFDMKNLTRLKKLDENAPDTMKAFWAFNKETFKAGAIDVLHKQLMAVAVALTTQCPYCIELHVQIGVRKATGAPMLVGHDVARMRGKLGAELAAPRSIFKRFS